jgi:hypothetical protein
MANAFVVGGAGGDTGGGGGDTGNGGGGTGDGGIVLAAVALATALNLCCSLLMRRRFRP